MGAQNKHTASRDINKSKHDYIALPFCEALRPAGGGGGGTDNL